MAQNKILGQTVTYDGDRMRWSILGKDPAAALDTNNFVFHDREGVVTRPGSQQIAKDVGGFGLFSYTYVSSAGSLISETLTVDKNLHRLLSGSFTVTYSGSNSNTYMTIYADGSTIYLDLYDNGTRVLNKDLGLGTEASPVTMAALKVAVDAVSDFSSVIVGTTTVSAAYLSRIAVDQGSLASAVAVSFRYSEQIASLDTDPFSSYIALRNGVEFENVSSVNHKNCLYLAFPSSGLGLYKYDSQSVYRAGLAAGEIPRYSSRSVGSISSAVRYQAAYIYTDAVGNTIESEISLPTTEITLSAEDMELSLSTIITGSGYNTNAAKVVGTQSVAPSSGVVTLAVDDGVGGAQSLVAGDTAYLYNRSTSAYSTYTVSSASSNSISLTSSDTIDLNDNDVISANLRIALYRTQAGGSNFYLVAEIANDPFQDVLLYTDSTADVSGNALFIEQTKTQSAPPLGINYVENVGDNLFIAKDNIVYYSDEGNSNASSEIFPADDNQQTVYSTRGGRITGMTSGSKNTPDISSNILYVFGDEFVRGLVGDFISDNYAEIEISDRYGCVSSASISKIGQSTVFMSKTGLRALTNGALEPEALTAEVDPYFTTRRLLQSDKLQLRRSVTSYDSLQDRLLVFIPKEGTSVNTYSTSESETLMYDLTRKSWLKWKGIDMTGGAVFVDDELIFSDRALIDSGKTHKLQSSGYGVDYFDHEAGIVQEYRTDWERLSKAKARWIRPFCIIQDDVDHIASFALNIKTYRDYLPATVHSDIAITRTGVGNSWGSSMPWGQSFGSHLEVSPKRRLRKGKSSAMQFLFESTASGAPMIISRWQVYYATPYRMDGGMKE